MRHVSNFILIIYFLFFYIFLIAMLGFSFIRLNILRILFNFELIALILAFLFLIVGLNYNDIYSHIVVLYILTIAAVEAAIGLALVYVYYRIWRTVKLFDINKLKG
jgi:NADH-quinone oxidoreductase subunit K